MDTITVDIVSAEGHIFSGEASMVIAPAKLGDVGIVVRHAPMLTELRPGEVRVKREGEEELFLYITGGLLEVQPFAVTILADTALRDDQLNEQAAEEARAAAEEALRTAGTREDLAHAQQQLVEAAARYRAAQKLKGKRR
ncbi:MAG: F0F1 ATP synthase subunit epsilon [Chromatiales bacterium]|nr:F0F1 ATP synthase subunit epsilon [Chromatiales bacterium]